MVDLIFAARQLIEKIWEYDKVLIFDFIEKEKALDSVKRCVISKSLRQEWRKNILNR